MENNQYTSSESSALVDFDFEEETHSTISCDRVMIAAGCTTETYTWISEDENLYLTQNSRTSSYVGKPIEFYKTTDPATMRDTIARELGTWRPLPEQVRQQAIDQLYTRTREMINQNRTTYATCIIKSRVDRTIQHVNSDVIMQQSFEESVNKMVPATGSSIKALKKIILVDGSCAERCSVCLEDFPDGCQVLCMPCSHEFHPDCITKWLSTSHYCPNCRYEMPKEE